VTTLASSLAVAGCGGAVAPDHPKGHDTVNGESTQEPEADGGDSDAAPVDEASTLVEADVYDAGVDVGWVGCYGAPPARLERRALARLDAPV